MKRTMAFMLLKNRRPITNKEMRHAFLEAKGKDSFKNYRFWLSLTTEEIEEKILFILKHQRINMDDLEKRYFANFYAFINASFIWTDTKEGHCFWLEIANLGI